MCLWPFLPKIEDRVYNVVAFCVGTRLDRGAEECTYGTLEYGVCNRGKKGYSGVTKEPCCRCAEGTGGIDWPKRKNVPRTLILRGGGEKGCVGGGPFEPLSWTPPLQGSNVGRPEKCLVRLKKDRSKMKSDFSVVPHPPPTVVALMSGQFRLHLIAHKKKGCSAPPWSPVGTTTRRKMNNLTNQRN